MPTCELRRGAHQNPSIVHKGDCPDLQVSNYPFLVQAGQPILSSFQTDNIYLIESKLIPIGASILFVCSSFLSRNICMQLLKIFQCASCHTLAVELIIPDLSHLKTGPCRSQLMQAPLQLVAREGKTNKQTNKNLFKGGPK